MNVDICLEEVDFLRAISMVSKSLPPVTRTEAIDIAVAETRDALERQFRGAVRVLLTRLTRRLEAEFPPACLDCKRA